VEVDSFQALFDVTCQLTLQDVVKVLVIRKSTVLMELSEKFIEFVG
jgi:hypothetical protein